MMTSRRGFLQAMVAAGVAGPLLRRAQALEASLPPRAVSTSLRADRPASIRALRGQYLLADDLIYLNHASIGTVPRPVVQAHAAYLELCESHPSLYVWGPVWRRLLEDTRRALSQHLSCSPDDLAITHNTTEGFNVLAHGLPLEAGDEVLFSSLNHPGASVAWRGLARRRGFTVRTFELPIPRTPDLTVEEIVALHVDAVRPETRALVLPHVDNMVGITHPLPEIAQAVRGRGVDFVLVDGAQSVGMIPVELSTTGVDAYAASPHKWLQAPKGLGLLWVSSTLRSVMPRMWFRTPGDSIRDSARKYEDYSTRAWPAVVALGDALDFQRSIGVEEKHRRYDALWRRIHERVEAESGLTWRSPRAEPLRSMIIAVQAKGSRAPLLAPRLLEGVGGVVRAFGPPLDAIRLSPNLCTTDDELERFLDALAARAG